MVINTQNYGMIHKNCSNHFKRFMKLDEFDRLPFNNLIDIGDLPINPTSYVFNNKYFQHTFYCKAFLVKNGNINHINAPNVQIFVNQINMSINIRFYFLDKLDRPNEHG